MQSETDETYELGDRTKTRGFRHGNRRRGAGYARLAAELGAVDRVLGGRVDVEIRRARALLGTRGRGFPIGSENDPDAAGISILAEAQADTAAPVIAGLG